MSAPTDPAREELLDELLDVALEAAERAGTLLRDGRPADLGVAATKTSAVDVVTEMDLAAEKLITEIIGRRRPADGLLGEEGADTPGTSGVRWIVDPLDGTVNYLYGLPAWGVSIAAELRGEVVVGVVAAPMRGETCRAVRGRGAHLGDTVLRCREDAPLERALVATGFGYVRARRVRQAAIAAEVIPLVRDVRRAGAAALDLCDVAAGRLDGYWERGLNPWDLAAGVLIAEEAGARTGGRPGRPASGELVVAGSPGVHAALTPILEDLGAWHD
ncbi:inositol monophosphatase family protein [Streptomyces sp. BI20]|uniref:inositol monophosphatase family protein n=1 Tax=Streptomyces sp. BI20 TaxID=3403460 RepID=UPI003C7963EA